MDTTKIYEPDFLNCDLIKSLPTNQRVGTIIDEGELIEMNLDNRLVKRLRVNVEFPNKGVKAWTIHRGSRSILATKFGDDSRAWVGKPLRFSVINTGKRDIILIEPLAEEFFKPYGGVIN